MTNLVYGAAETRAKIAEIQSNVKRGLISKLINKNTRDTSYILNQKMLESILEHLDKTCIVEYDEVLKCYTAYSNIIPQIYAEADSKKQALANMVTEAKSFAYDYAENIDLFSEVLDGFQQFIMGNILLNIDDDDKIKEILNIG